MAKHISKATVEWAGGFNGVGKVSADGVSATVTLPKDFGGRGEGTSPEELFLCSTASCHLITLGIILDKAGVAYESLAIDGSLSTEVGPPAAMEEVTLTVTIDTSAPIEKLQALNQRVEDFCVISKATRGLKKTVKIQKKGQA